MLGDKPMDQWIIKNDQGNIIWATFDKNKADKYIRLN